MNSGSEVGALYFASKLGEMCRQMNNKLPVTLSNESHILLLEDARIEVSKYQRVREVGHPLDARSPRLQAQAAVATA